MDFFCSLFIDRTLGQYCKNLSGERRSRDSVRYLALCAHLDECKNYQKIWYCPCSHRAIGLVGVGSHFNFARFSLWILFKMDRGIHNVDRSKCCSNNRYGLYVHQVRTDIRFTHATVLPVSCVKSLTKTPDVGGFLYSKSVVDNETEYWKYHSDKPEPHHDRLFAPSDRLEMMMVGCYFPYFTTEKSFW